MLLHRPAWCEAAALSGTGAQSAAVPAPNELAAVCAPDDLPTVTPRLLPPLHTMPRCDDAFGAASASSELSSPPTAASSAWRTASAARGRAVPSLRSAAPSFRPQQQPQPQQPWDDSRGQPHLLQQKTDALRRDLTRDVIRRAFSDRHASNDATGRYSSAAAAAC